MRHGPLLERRRERERAELRTDALDGRVEPVEGAVLDDSRELRAEAAARDRLVAVTHRFVFLTESRIVCSSSGCSVRGIDDLDRDPVLLRFLGGTQRLVHETARSQRQ